MYRVSQCVMHPEAATVPTSCFSNTVVIANRHFDLALLRLTVVPGQDLPTSNWAQPMAVLTNVRQPNAIDPVRWEGEEVGLAGWGRMSDRGLQTQQRLRGANLIDSFIFQGTAPLDRLNFMLRQFPDMAYAFQADSGSPLLWVDRLHNNQFAVIGVTSGLGPDRQDNRMRYATTIMTQRAFRTQLDPNLPGDWLEAQMGDLFPNGPGTAASHWRGEPIGAQDNCADVRNPEQTDTDGDGRGDACDRTPTFADGAPSTNLLAPPYQWYTLGRNPQLIRSCLSRTAAADGGRNMLDFDAPGPCAPIQFFNVPSRLQRFTPEGSCTVGGNELGIAYAPTRDPNDPRGAETQSNSVVLRRCACWDFMQEAVVDEQACYTTACRPSGRLERNGSSTQGRGWFYEHLPPPSSGATQAVRAYSNHPSVAQGVLEGTLNLISENSIFASVLRQAPVYTFASRASAPADAYNAWRAQVGGAMALTFNWLGYDSNPMDANKEARDQMFWPDGFPAFTGTDSQLAHVVYWSRTQTVPRPDPFARGSFDATSPRYREQRSSDHYSSMLRMLREQPYTLPCRYSAPMTTWWGITGQSAAYAPRFLHPAVNTAQITPSDRLVPREMVAVIPVSPDAQGLNGFKWNNGPNGSPVAGVVIAQLNVRNAVWTIAADSAGPSSELPNRLNASYAMTAPDEWGWPTVYAFGGIDVDGKPSNALFRGVPVTDANHNATYQWTRLNFANAPSARVDHAMMLGGDGQSLYVAGGRDLLGNLLGDLHRYNIADKTWTLVSNTLTPRAEMGMAAADDLLYLGGGVEGSGSESGRIVRIDGLNGLVTHDLTSLPTGAWPDLSVTPHADGLIYAGGRVGSTWYRDIWRVDFTDTSVSATFLHNFANDGLVASQRYAVQGDLLHGFFWGVPGWTGGPNAIGTWFVSGNGQGQATPPGGSGPLLRSASASTGTPPARQRGSALTTGRAQSLRPGRAGEVR